MKFFFSFLLQKFHFFASEKIFFFIRYPATREKRQKFRYKRQNCVAGDNKKIFLLVAGDKKSGIMRPLELSK
jgi:hypothetical protein